jgi:hypothetical protein
MKMMNDIAIENITNIMNAEIAKGHSVLGLVSAGDDGGIFVCWRTDDPAKAARWQASLRESLKHDDNIYVEPIINPS